MKPNITLFLFLFASLIPKILYCQTAGTTCHEAIIPLQIREHESLCIFKDTLIFEENFEHFLSEQINNSTPIGGTSCLYTLPRSLTQKPYCRAKGITVKREGITNDAYCLMEQGGAFATPKLNIPVGSVVKMFVKKTSNKKDVLLEINDTTIKITSSIKNITDTIRNNCDNITITNKSTYSTSIYIDSITITTPRDVLSSKNYVLSNDTLRIHNLSPATKYYVEICDTITAETRQYSFETKRQIEHLTSRVQGSNTVKLSLTNNGTQTAPTIHLYKVNNATQDLFFSRIATKSSNYGLEIFNGTGKDICLGDYKVRFVDSGSETATTNKEYHFSPLDTIHRNSYIMVCYKLEELNSYDFVSFPIELRTSFLGGNDAYLLLKKDITGEYRDTIDLFGRTIPGSGTAGLSYQDRILTRKGSIITGVKHNPQINPDLTVEWDTVYFKAASLNDSSLRHKLNNPISYSHVRDISITPGQDEILLENLEAQSRYLCIMTVCNDTVASLCFDTGKILNSEKSGAWNDPSTWETACLPEPTDKVIIRKGHKVNVPIGTNLECNELLLQSDYSTAYADSNKAELIIDGILKADKITVETSFSAYTANTNGWNFFGVPIDVKNLSANEVGRFFQRTYDDDLYYLDEALYSWIPYSEYHDNENFFTNSTGYLVAYKDNKTLSFEGNLFLRDSIRLLKNASFTANTGNGYHLVCNPYPFSVGLNNFRRESIDGFWLLDPSTGAYFPSDNNQVSDFRVPPFGGFMTKVSSTSNGLSLHKKLPSQSKSKSSASILGSLYFNLISEGGKDEVRLYVRNDASMWYDEYDTYKLFSVGSAPDMWFSIAGDDLSVAAIGDLSDSVNLNLKVSDKLGGKLKILLPKRDAFFEQITLLEHGTDSVLCNFMSDSAYSFVCDAGSIGKKFDLRLKWHSFDNNTTDDGLKFSQSGRMLRVDVPLRVDELLLFDLQGRVVAVSHSNFISLPTEGCFVLRVSSGSKVFSSKVIVL